MFNFVLGTCYCGSSEIKQGKRKRVNLGKNWIEMTFYVASITNGHFFRHYCERFLSILRFSCHVWKREIGEINQEGPPFRSSRSQRWNSDAKPQQRIRQRSILAHPSPKARVTVFFLDLDWFHVFLRCLSLTNKLTDLKINQVWHTERPTSWLARRDRG